MKPGSLPVKDNLWLFRRGFRDGVRWRRAGWRVV